MLHRKTIKAFDNFSKKGREQLVATHKGIPNDTPG